MGSWVQHLKSTMCSVRGFSKRCTMRLWNWNLARGRFRSESKPRLHVHFKDCLLKKHYEADFLVHSAIVVEIKAVRTVTPEFEAQLLNELRITRHRVGYLINFGAWPRLQWSRRVL
jgi:GxxExxY protein